jgi:hypothetical protein
MQKRFVYFVILTFSLSVNYFAQVSLPRESAGATVIQTVGDTQITIVYHRPNTKGRKIWGELVPFGEVWRAGANENTTFEVSRDVSINGKPLPKGKYGFHIIPDKNEWILIFNKVNNAWGSFNYDEKQDALRIKVVPKVSKEMRESLMYEFASVTPRSTEVVLSWEKLRVSFTVDIGDIFGRKIAELREAIEKRQPNDVRPLNAAANYIYTFRIKDKYPEALNWIEESIKIGETFSNLAIKARLLADSGKTAEAIVTGEKAVQVGKNSTPPANPNAVAALETEIQKWKNGKK